MAKKRVGTQSDQPFIKLYREFMPRWTPWEVWQDFVMMLACTISNAVDGSHFDERKAMYLKRIQKYNKKEQEIFPQLAAETVMALEKNPEQDFLGKIFMELNLSNDSGGQFFTPYTVCKMMAEMTLNDIVSHVKEHGYITINDPACGAGATLIAAIHAAAKPLGKAGLNWQNHVLITAQDIDYTVAMMCYIQLSLLGAAAYIKIGNSLTEPMSSNDTLENYWFTPMYFCEPWSLRRSIKGRVLL